MSVKRKVGAVTAWSFTNLASPSIEPVEQTGQPHRAIARTLRGAAFYTAASVVSIGSGVAMTGFVAIVGAVAAGSTGSGSAG